MLSNAQCVEVKGVENKPVKCITHSDCYVGMDYVNKNKYTVTLELAAYNRCPSKEVDMRETITKVLAPGAKHYQTFYQHQGPGWDFDKQCMLFFKHKAYKCP